MNQYADIPVVSTVPEVAAILGCSERHVRNLITRGILGHVRLGRLVKVPRHSLLEVLGAEIAGSNNRVFANPGPSGGSDVEASD